MLTSYPSSSFAVASQQGKYLAQRFNSFAHDQVRAGKMKDEGGKDHWELQQKLVKAGVYNRIQHPPIFSCGGGPGSNATNTPFRYRHLGNLAYIGAENAAIDLGEAGSYKGWLTFWLWKVRIARSFCGGVVVGADVFCLPLVFSRVCTSPNPSARVLV